MRGAQALFDGRVIRWGGRIETTVNGPTPIIWENRYDGTGVYAIEIGSQYVYALVVDHALPFTEAPIWVRLP